MSTTHDLTVPKRLQNITGEWPDAEKFMDNYDFLAALLAGSFIANGGEETWGTTSFSSPADGAALNTGWTNKKSGTTGATATISREGTIINEGTYAKKFDITGAGSSDSLIGDYQAALNPTTLAGYTIIFGRSIRASTASKVRLRVYDGTTSYYSSYHTGGGAYEKLTVKASLPAATTSVTVYLEITSNFTGQVYADNAFLYIVPSAISDAAIALLTYQLAFEATSYLPLSGGTVTGVLTVSGQLIGKGTTTNDSAAAGYVGEYIESVTSSNTAEPSTTVYDDLLSLSLTAGDWDVTGIIYHSQEGATWTRADAGISTTSGNSTTGLTLGQTLTTGTWASSSTTPSIFMAIIPSVRISLASTTTVYLKRRCDYSAGSPLSRGARISARRVR